MQFASYLVIKEMPTPSETSFSSQNSKIVEPSAHIARLSASKIREVANSAMGQNGVMAFWFGEPYQATPAFIRSAAKHALDQGDTFYHQNLGSPALRTALAHYISGLHRPVASNRIAVTSSGVNALMLAAQLILSPGDRVVAITPLWPNITEIPLILGASVERVSLQISPLTQRWELDLQTLLIQLTANTRAVIINSPNNPTGWVMPATQMQAVLEHCRKLGIWIFSDEAYERLVFNGERCAPSMLDFAHADDRLLVANTFSKAWQMTGWRLGWLVAPPLLESHLAKLIEFNTSCAPGFVQAAAVAALQQGESTVKGFVDELSQASRLMTDALGKMPEVICGIPEGAMYVFFKIQGETDSLALAKKLVREQGLGLAPGIAFGPEGESYLRWCFAKPPELLERGLAAFKRALRA
jgi:aspartate/methionine/tyrosine aminotransferase